MRPTLVICCLLLAGAAAGISQTVPGKTGTNAEPPELTGAPKKVTQPSEADKEFLEIGIAANPDEAKTALPKLNSFIAGHTDYSDAYFLRATYEACILNDTDFNLVVNDLNAAISGKRGIYTDRDYYSLLGKIALREGKPREAMSHLEKAMTKDLDTAERMFNVEGIAPEKTSKPCVWNLTDLNGLIGKFPKDYRPYLFRGLYYLFFTSFKEDYYPRALLNFQTAALLKPTSPLPQYFIGRLHSQASFWAKKAWTSDAGRDEEVRNAAQAYSKAIRLDASFLPAYEERASDYLELKRYPEALRDYEKVLTLDPNNVIAYSDRGLARLESGQYFAAISDFGEAIRRKNEADAYLPTLYENRGDARAKLKLFPDAISDYSKAIALNLASATILLSLKQVRALYPELDQVSDEALTHKIHDQFWPNMDYTDFVKQIERNGKWEVSFLLSELYEKRGDAYLRAGDYRQGAADFRRIFQGIPNMADSVDRWRPLGSTPEGSYSLDVKSAEFPGHGPVELWIRMIGRKTSQKTAYRLDCAAKKINETATVSYDSQGKVLGSSDAYSEWQPIIPDTLGEQLFDGACTGAEPAPGPN